LGWAEITHPFHPRRGQTFPVIKTRQVSGIEVLYLKTPAGGFFSIAREWTDWAELTFTGRLGMQTPILDFHSLLELAELVDQLNRRTPEEGVDK
jgi:Family of unknown function (DUF5372)